LDTTNVYQQTAREQISRLLSDLGAANERADDAEREIRKASERARRAEIEAENLRGELHAAQDYVGILEQRVREFTEDNRRLEEQVKFLINGITAAQGDVAESGRLLEELGKILLGIQSGSGS